MDQRLPNPRILRSVQSCSCWVCWLSIASGLRAVSCETRVLSRGAVLCFCCLGICQTNSQAAASSSTSETLQPSGPTSKTKALEKAASERFQTWPENVLTGGSCLGWPGHWREPQAASQLSATGSVTGSVAAVYRWARWLWRLDVTENLTTPNLPGWGQIGLRRSSNRRISPLSQPVSCTYS